MLSGKRSSSHSISMALAIRTRASSAEPGASAVLAWVEREEELGIADDRARREPDAPAADHHARRLASRVDGRPGRDRP